MDQKKERHTISAKATKPEKSGKYKYRKNTIILSLTFKDRVVDDKQTIIQFLEGRGEEIKAIFNNKLS